MKRELIHLLLAGIAGASFLCASSAPAQMLTPKVAFHTDKLPDEEKEFILGLDEKLRLAVENTHWEGTKQHYRLPINYDLFWDKATRTGAVHKYSAGVLVTTGNGGISLKDKRVEFRHAEGDWIHIGEPYDPLSGMLEFYTWICLGFEADRTALLGGNQFYEKARLLGERARAEAQYSLGWDERRSLSIELTDSLYVPARKARFYQAAADYYMEAGNTPQTQAALARTVKIVASRRVEEVNFEFDDHSLRFVDLEKLKVSLDKMNMEDELDQLREWMVRHSDEE